MLNKNNLLLILCIGLSKVTHSQGGWNIQYLSPKHIDSFLIGKEVRFDFKHNNEDTLLNSKITKLEIRRLLGNEDTIELTILNKTIAFTEKWELYADEGFIKNQSLVSLIPPGLTLGKMTPKSISRNCIVVDAEFFKDGNSKTIELVIDKKIIKGILLKE